MSKTFRIYWRGLKGYRTLSVLSILSTGLSGLLEGTALMFLIPILGQGMKSSGSTPMPSIFNSLIAHINRGKISLFLAFILIAVVSALVRLIAEVLTLRVRNAVEQSLREKIGKVLFYISWPYFLTQRLGNVGKSLVVDTSHAADGCQVFLSVLGMGLVAIFFIIISFLISVPMTLFTFAFGGIAASVYYLAGRRAIRHTFVWHGTTGNMSEQITEIFNNLKYIRAANAMPQAIRETEKAYALYCDSFFKSYFYKSMLKFVVECLAVCLMAGFLAYGFFWSGKGPEFAVVFLAVFYRLVPRIQTLQDSFYTASIHAVWVADLNDRYVALSANQENDEGKLPPGDFDALTFDDIGYHYEKSQPVLKHLRFSVRKGEIVLLSGDSGSGKSTLIDLTLGLIRPTEGRILLGDRSLTDVSLAAWRAKIGLVLQGTPIFYGSILDNIALMDPTPDRAKAERCAEMADCLDFIRNLPEGFDTQIQEKGSRLSGGQRQRLALARALYRNPWILVLDEPTSELDAESQARIIKTLTRLKADYAILMSSHRAETMSLADKILRLPAGTLEAAPSPANA